jgi:CxxC-x17-CxxC domain-containing protein
LGLVFEDKSIDCKDCGEPFIFTAGEQGFYLEKGLLNQPQRCPACREQRRREREEAARTGTTIVCAECGRETTVPFVPHLNRPVYCSACFQQVREGAPV